MGAGHRADVALQDQRCALLSQSWSQMLRSAAWAACAWQRTASFSPRLDLYRGASLLYSIRPPLELQMAMGRAAARVGADVLVRPLENEVAELPGFTRRLVNAGEARFYLFRLRP